MSTNEVVLNIQPATAVKIAAFAALVTEHIKLLWEPPRVIKQLISLVICSSVAAAAAYFGFIGNPPDYLAIFNLIIASWFSSMGFYETTDTLARAYVKYKK